MGSITFDPIVNSISKQVGNFVYTSWKGKNIIKKQRTKYPSTYTARQIEVQKTFKEVSQIWKALPLLMQQSWKKSVSGLAMTEFNMFVKTNFDNVSEGTSLTLTKNTGITLPRGLAVTSESQGSAVIRFTATEITPFLSVLFQMITDDAASPLEIKYDVTVNEGSATVDGLESAKDYFVYLISTDKPFTEATMISESTGFKVTVA